MSSIRKKTQVHSSIHILNDSSRLLTEHVTFLKVDILVLHANDINIPVILLFKRSVDSMTNSRDSILNNKYTKKLHIWFYYISQTYWEQGRMRKVAC